MTIEFINLGNEFDVREFLNFTAKRGLKVLYITHGVTTEFAVWFEVPNSVLAAGHREEFFEELLERRSAKQKEK